MTRKVETLHQNNVTNRAIDFIRENELVQEIDNKPVITNKGEQFLHELQGSSRRSNSGISGAI
jgi:hypothetical protein